MSLAIPTVIIQDDLGNTMSMTPTQLETGSGVTLQTTPLTFLSNLGYALNALTQPTDPTTCNFQNAIGVQDTATMPTNSIVKLGGDPATLFGIEYTSATNADLDIKTTGTGKVKINAPLLLDNGAGNTITAGSNQIDFTSTAINPSVISNSSGQDMNVVSSNTLNLSAALNLDTTCSTINTTAVNDIFMVATNSTIALTAGTNINLVSSNFGSIQTVAPNFNCNGSAMPCCFTRERADTFSYTLGGQALEQVYTTQFNIPQAFVADTPVSGYTSTIWKIDFALNCWNCSSTGDKGLALFFTLQDQTTSINMSPQTYNANTPYAVWQPSSSYTAGSGNNQFQNFNWTDWIDLAPLVGLGGGVLPLNLLLNFAADNAFTCNFQMTVTLTRTNLV